MTFVESLDYLTFLAYVVVEVVVLFNVFPLWRRLRHPFLALLCIGAALGLYATATDYTLGLNPISQRQYYWYWVTRQFVGIAAMGFYGAGIFFMVRYLVGIIPDTTPSTSLSPNEPHA